MAKKQSFVPEVPEEFRQQYQSEYACFPISWRKRVDGLPDEVAGRLLKAVLMHCEQGSCVPPDGLDAFAFGLVLDKVDEYQERGLEFAWSRAFKAKNAAKSRWGGKEEQGQQANAQECPSIPENAQECHNNISIPISISTSIPNNTTNTKPTREESRGVAGEDGGEVVLSDYLTEDEEDRLFYAANYDSNMLEAFVLSDYFNHADNLETKEKRLLQFIEDATSRAFAEEEKERKAKEEAERAARLAAYKPCQRPKSLEELETFCSDIGHPEFSAYQLWCEMERKDWMTFDSKIGDHRPIDNWHAFVQYRIKKANNIGNE